MRVHRLLTASRLSCGFVDRPFATQLGARDLGQARGSGAGSDTKSLFVQPIELSLKGSH